MIAAGLGTADGLREEQQRDRMRDLGQVRPDSLTVLLGKECHEDQNTSVGLRHDDRNTRDERIQ